MIDSDRRPVSNRRPLLKSASTDVIISNHGPILGYSQIGVPSKLSYLYARLHDQSFAIKNNCNDNFSNRGRIYIGGPRKSDIVINKACDP